MKYMEFVNTSFYHFRVTSPKLCELLQNYFGFYVDDEDQTIISDWLVKADAYIGEDEKDITFCSRVARYQPLMPFDFITYLIELLTAHKDVGLSNFEQWREALRYYSPEEHENYSEDPLYEEQIEPNQIIELIDILKSQHKELSDDIQSFIIFEYTLDGEYESELNVLAMDADGHIVMEGYEEADINDWTGCENFVEDVLVYEYELDHIAEPICEEFGFE